MQVTYIYRVYVVYCNHWTRVITQSSHSTYFLLISLSIAIINIYTALDEGSRGGEVKWVASHPPSLDPLLTVSPIIVN